MYKKRFEKNGNTFTIVDYMENGMKSFCVFPSFIVNVQETIRKKWENPCCDGLYGE
jgi:hypothetical protein